MASTYSTNLKIELIGTGEQSGTWGTTTNGNLGTALEESIVGYGNPNFASDANLTISLTDTYTTQTARCFALNVTSGVSLTATRNLVVPTIQKQYLIRNNTTGSQSIVVKTSGGSGITVPNGSYTLVYVDGTNVVSQITQLPTLALGTALTVANGGTGVATLTGLVKGNGTSAFSAATVGSDYAAPATNQTWSVAQRGSLSSVSYAASVALDFNTSNNFSIGTLTGNITLANPTNVTAGQSGLIVLTQDGTGGRTITFGTNWKFENGVTPVLSTGASKVDYLSYFAQTSSFIFVTIIKAIA